MTKIVYRFEIDTEDYANCRLVKEIAVGATFEMSWKMSKDELEKIARLFGVKFEEREQ